MRLTSWRTSLAWSAPLVAAISLVTGLAIVERSPPDQKRPPRQLVSDARVPPKNARCAECHQEIAQRFAESGHARTLLPGNARELLARFVDQEFQWPSNGPRYRYVVSEQKVWLTRDDSPIRLPIDWILGDGHHGQTAVTLTINPAGATELWQHALSWYPQAGLALTPGFDASRPAQEGVAGLGEWLNHASALECLGCHATYLPMNSQGAIQSERIQVGVGCVRCHYDADRHVIERGATGSFLEKWPRLSPRESINRCGECHRQAEQIALMTPGPLHCDRTDLIRFAPVGLTQCRCFTGQEATGKDSPPIRLDCISCHMPTVETAPHLHLTDHWIRIRRK